MKVFKNIIDVREPWEFEEGHVEGAVNIPLGDVQSKLDEIKAMETPILMCCKSGGRSGVATNFLQNEGVNCENGGGWTQVQDAIDNKEVSLERA